MVDTVSYSKELFDAVSDSKELVDAVSNRKRDPSSDPNVATYSTNGNYPHRLLVNSEIPTIIQCVIPLVHQATVDGVLTCGGALHAVCTFLTEEIVTGAAPSAACVLKYPQVLNWKVASRPNPIDMNTVVVTPRVTTQVQIGTGTSAPPIFIRRQKIDSPRGSIGPQKFRNSPPFKNFINSFYSKHGHPMLILGKLIGCKTFSDVYVHKRMDFGSNSVIAEIPNFMDFGLSPTNTPD